VPLFEYECEECAARFEKYVTAPDKVVECKECGSTEVRKLISTFASPCRADSGV
jgi:putative FmdB family regulatory protein